MIRFWGCLGGGVGKEGKVIRRGDTIISLGLGQMHGRVTPLSGTPHQDCWYSHAPDPWMHGCIESYPWGLSQPPESNRRGGSVVTVVWSAERRPYSHCTNFHGVGVGAFLICRPPWAPAHPEQHSQDLLVASGHYLREHLAYKAPTWGLLLLLAPQGCCYAHTDAHFILLQIIWTIKSEEVCC